MNCEDDCYVLIQITEWTYAWVCGRHFMRYRFSGHFGKGYEYNQKRY